uniref:Uncharacterized protein LOC111137704 isoform X2 n=1 Tax=Crassostrea virginica TaxID=6565 RepID=A0A8B8EY96_CRAVI|nr:uncharacterized protein LOC111137704 isoform X2 [Crassostrea virginica]XP_022345011.1 uncharacterized protein LOC111137704 isoform X2 [Crassostrea virginica]
MVTRHTVKHTGQVYIYLAKNIINFTAQIKTSTQGKLRCGESNAYIKPECVCSFHNVYEATFYHAFSSCPEGTSSDMVTKLKCTDCKKYSLNNTGPCINGGKLTCRGEEVAPEITCQCPPNYEGKFCEIKIENVTRVCDMISNYSIRGLLNCAMTGRDCITYSRNMQYAYKCNETHFSQDRRGLPLCVDTENTTPRNVEHTLFESMPIQTNILINVEEKTTSTHLDPTFIDSPQREVILENFDWYTSGGNNIYSLSKLAVILGGMILQL